LFLAASVLAVAMAGCAPTRDLRGFVANAEAVAALTPGIDNQTSILEALGSPTALGTFDVNAWYYISRTTDTVAFFNEDVVDQQVVALAFDDAGVLASVTRFDLTDAIDIVPVDRATPTRGRELGIFEQFVGNIGRFNTPVE
jgi:outer membrane protein assembly factor BamE (lipoprotein component of BamABCDE complex)